MGKTFYYNESHKYIKREGSPGNYTYIYKSPEGKEDKWKESNKYVLDIEKAVDDNKKGKFMKLLKDREDKLKGFPGDNKSRDKFITIVRKGLSQFGVANGSR